MCNLSIVNHHIAGSHIVKLHIDGMETLLFCNGIVTVQHWASWYNITGGPLVAQECFLLSQGIWYARDRG
jgi:hypothetical protein